MMKTRSVTVLSACLLVGCALFERTVPSTLSNANILSVFDTIDQSEIEAAELALQKASSPAVQDYAHNIVQEHTAMKDKKRMLANQLSIKPEKPRLAPVLQATNRKAIETLRTKSGSDFDKAYTDYQITMHEKAIRLAQETADIVDDSRLKQYLIDTHAYLQSHFKKAQGIRQQLRGEG